MSLLPDPPEPAMTDPTVRPNLLDREAVVAVDLVRALIAVATVVGLTVPDNVDPEVVGAGVAGLIAVYLAGAKLIRSRVWSAQSHTIKVAEAKEQGAEGIEFDHYAEGDIKGDI